MRVDNYRLSINAVIDKVAEVTKKHGWTESKGSAIPRMFQSANLITNHNRRFYRKVIAGEKIWFELSSGSGFYRGTELVGLSFCMSGSERLADDPSDCFVIEISSFHSNKKKQTEFMEFLSKLFTAVEENGGENGE